MCCTLVAQRAFLPISWCWRGWWSGWGYPTSCLGLFGGLSEVQASLRGLWEGLSCQQVRISCLSFPSCRAGLQLLQREGHLPHSV